MNLIHMDVTNLNVKQIKELVKDLKVLEPKGFERFGNRVFLKIGSKER